MKTINKIIVITAMMTAVLPVVSKAKGGDEQDQIILLNDSAAAIEDSDPDLSKRLTKFADEEEKDWEAKNASKKELPTPLIDHASLQEHIKLLKEAVRVIGPTYPLIAKSLDKMAVDLNKATT